MSANALRGAVAPGIGPVLELRAQHAQAPPFPASGVWSTCIRGKWARCPDQPVGHLVGGLGCALAPAQLGIGAHRVARLVVGELGLAG